MAAAEAFEAFPHSALADEQQLLLLMSAIVTSPAL